MLPTLPMLAKKIRVPCGLILFLLLAVFLTGCTPPGPRALLKGKKLLDRGDYAAAVEQLKTATALLPSNAPAWNYLGVALPARRAAGGRGGGVSTRARARPRPGGGALQSRLHSGWSRTSPTRPVTEFTAYTLRRRNEPEGWLKLGSAQLHAQRFSGGGKKFQHRAVPEARTTPRR